MLERKAYSVVNGGKVTDVVLCDDHPIVRDAIWLRMARSSSVRIVGEAGDGREVLDVVEELDPDVVIIDVEMPRRDGIEATRDILRARPRTKVIVFTGHNEPDLVALALRAGASGHVLKSASAEEIAKAVEVVAGGGIFFGREIVRGRPTEVDRVLDLSPRERHILELLAEGLRAREIADRLFIGSATVDSHVRHAIAKLGVETRTEAVALIVRFGYLSAAGSG